MRNPTKSPKDQSIVLVSCKVSGVKKPKQIKSTKEKAKDRKKVGRTEISTVFLCGICKMDVSDSPGTFNEVLIVTLVPYGIILDVLA